MTAALGLGPHSGVRAEPEKGGDGSNNPSVSEGKWPCEVPFEPELAIADVWEGPAQEPPSGNWRAPSEGKRTVDEAFARIPSDTEGRR